MIWYESAKLAHGRPERFTGHYYDNIFVHFKPKDRKWCEESVMQVTLLIPWNTSVSFSPLRTRTKLY